MRKKVVQLFRTLFVELEDEDMELLNYRRNSKLLMDEDFEFTV